MWLEDYSCNSNQGAQYLTKDTFSLDACQAICKEQGATCCYTNVYFQPNPSYFQCGFYKDPLNDNKKYMDHVPTQSPLHKYHAKLSCP